MTREDELRAEIRRLEDERDSIAKRLMSAEEELATLACPFILGDVVRFDAKKWGAHKTSDLYKISSIRPGWNPGEYRLFGFKLKKDGDPGRREVELYSFYGAPVKVDGAES